MCHDRLLGSSCALRITSSTAVKRHIFIHNSPFCFISFTASLKMSVENPLTEVDLERKNSNGMTSVVKPTHVLQLPQIISSRPSSTQPVLPRFVTELPPATPQEHTCWRITPAHLSFDSSTASTVTVRLTNIHTHQLRAAVVPNYPSIISLQGATSGFVSSGISFTQTITFTPDAALPTPYSTNILFRCQSPSSTVPYVLALRRSVSLPTRCRAKT